MVACLQMSALKCGLVTLSIDYVAYKSRRNGTSVAATSLPIQSFIFQSSRGNSTPNRPRCAEDEETAPSSAGNNAKLCHRRLRIRGRKKVPWYRSYVYTQILFDSTHRKTRTRKFGSKTGYRGSGSFLTLGLNLLQGLCQNARGCIGRGLCLTSTERE